MRISNKPDFVSSIVLFFSGIIFYFVIIPREIILEDEAVIGPDLLPNICIILINLERLIRTAFSSNGQVETRYLVIGLKGLCSK